MEEMVDMAIMMSSKEIAEGRRVGIPEYLLGKMIYGMDLSEREKEVVKGRGKVYVLGHRKYNGRTVVNPQLRDLPDGGRSNPGVNRNNPNEEVNIKEMSNRELNKYLMELQSNIDELKPKFTIRFREAMRKGVSYKSPEGRKIEKMGGRIDDIESLQDNVMDEMDKRGMKIPVIRE